MNRRSTPRKQRFEVESIALDPASPESLFRQLERELRAAIADGRMTGGFRLPSTRKFAAALGVSRNTVLAAFEQLTSEGYLESATGSGTFVSDSLPGTPAETTKRRAGRADRDLSRELSRTGRLLRQWSGDLPELSLPARPFRPHLPAVDEFPAKEWNRVEAEVSRWSSERLQAADPQGYAPLRRAIAEYMAVSRGVACSESQIVVTAGSQQGLHLLTQVLLDPGETLCVEEPGNAPAYQLFDSLGIRLSDVGLDAEGIDVEAMKAAGLRPKMIYVTPGGQWPMAMTMSVRRRMELIEFATTHGSWIIEDDYNGEFRHVGRPHPALTSLDAGGRTIYMGSFSKLLFPAMRLGFLVVPESITPAVIYGRWLFDRFAPPAVQMVLYRFIESGRFLKHVRRMAVLYRQRREAIGDALRRTFGDALRFELPDSGMHLVVEGRTKAVSKRLLGAADRAGIEYHPVAIYSRRASGQDAMILGFAGFSVRDIQLAVERWGREYRQ